MVKKLICACTHFYLLYLYAGVRARALSVLKIHTLAPTHMHHTLLGTKSGLIYELHTFAHMIAHIVPTHMHHTFIFGGGFIT